MLLDKENLFTDQDGQAITATTSSDFAIDLGAISSRVQQNAIRGPIKVHAQVVEDFTNLTSLDIALRTSASSNMGTPTVLRTVNVVRANLVAGLDIFARFDIPVDAKRYLDILFTVNGGSPPDAGKILAGLVIESQLNGQ